jgi:hypothetical protein
VRGAKRITIPGTKYWLGVACAAHVRRGIAGGFMQLGHGKEAPLRRLRAGDGIVYYSPSVEMAVADSFQSFTAIGSVRDDAIYRADMGPDFKPWRRDVEWREATDAPIRPLLDDLTFTAGRPNWGYALRRGLIPIDERDFQAIRHAMRAEP